MPPKTKKRPGVEASMNLASLDNARTWRKVEKHCAQVIDSIPNLRSYEDDLRVYGKNTKEFSKEDLDKIVLWKHTVGKNRIYNVKYLQANSPELVFQHSHKAIQMAREIDANVLLDNDGNLTPMGREAVQAPLMELSKLKGVGPATASAALTLVRPDVFCYLYDEAIDTFEATRDYKMSNYLRVNTRCLAIAQTLGGDWTAGRVAKTIWTAARFLVLSGEDLTEEDSVKYKKRKATSKETGDPIPAGKEKRKRTASSMET